MSYYPSRALYDVNIKFLSLKFFYRFQLLFLAFASILFYTKFAWACRCGYQSPDGFVPSINPSTSNGKVVDAVHLPKNARGVLYYRSSRAEVSYGDGERSLLQDVPKPLKETDFNAVDETTGLPVDVVVRKLLNDTNEHKTRYFAPDDNVLKDCIASGLTDGCESIRESMIGSDWLLKLLVQKKYVK